MRKTVDALRERWARASVVGRVYWLLRLGVAVEYLAHGWAGLGGTRAWLPYYDVFGIPTEVTLDYLLYVVGTVDVVVGLLVLLRPVRVVVLYAVLWAAFTALLRPFSGGNWWELPELAGNVALPLALLFLVGSGGRSAKAWLGRALPLRRVSDLRHLAVHWVARVGVVLLLIGHGGLVAFGEQVFWYKFFAFFGVHSGTVYSANLLLYAGAFEILLGLAVLIRPARPLLWFVLGWKLLTELLRPLVGGEWIEFVLRDADYVLPAVLLVGSATYAAARVRLRPLG